jgi:hypothetical protein
VDRCKESVCNYILLSQNKVCELCIGDSRSSYENMKLDINFTGTYMCYDIKLYDYFRTKLHLRIFRSTISCEPCEFGLRFDRDFGEYNNDRYYAAINMNIDTLEISTAIFAKYYNVRCSIRTLFKYMIAGEAEKIAEYTDQF